MKKITTIEYTIVPTIVLVIFLFSFKSSVAQVTVTVSIPTGGISHSIDDFYGLNGQDIFSSASNYNEPAIRTGILQSHPSYLRYPGGTNANFWDWQEGWMFRNIADNGPLSLDLKLQKQPRLIDVFQSPTSQTLNFRGADYIKDFCYTLAGTGTKPLFTLNPLTSDIYYQVAMLLEAKLQNLDVKRVEIGNEFYLSRVSYQERNNLQTNFKLIW